MEVRIGEIKACQLHEGKGFVILFYFNPHYSSSDISTLNGSIYYCYYDSWLSGIGGGCAVWHPPGSVCGPVVQVGKTNPPQRAHSASQDALWSRLCKRGPERGEGMSWPLFKHLTCIISLHPYHKLDSCIARILQIRRVRFRER